jgi:Flp pilus assembly pilin Flp
MISGFLTSLFGRLRVMSIVREDGQTLAEYVLILAFIALVCVGAVSLLAGPLSGMFESIGSKI